MMRHPDVKKNVESFIMQRVVPEFSSGDAYMRAVVSVKR